MRFCQVAKNITYSFAANIVSLGVSVLMVMFVPKLLPVEEYGKWQLFLFYFSYLGFLHFGWEDGIYLRYAGKSFNELSPRVFSGQFLGIVILQLILAGLAFLFSRVFITDPIKQSVLISAVSLAVFVNFNMGCNFIMQITNRIKEYAHLILSERVLLLCLVFSFLLLGLNQFRYLYFAKLGSLAVVSFISFYMCRQLWTTRIGSFREIFHEAGLNLEVGIKLMFANIASMLIIGIVRYGISIGWDISTFGKVSLTLGVSNFLMIFINSVSVVFFPILKRMDQQHLPVLYQQIRTILSCVLFFMLIFYYPIREILAWWLPKYADALVYMSILFPVCVFESKMGLLINTYLKSMRQEALMLKINIISVMVSAIVTWFTVDVFHNLDVAIFSVVFLYAFRCLLAEFWIGKLLHLQLYRKMAIDCGMCTVFILSGWCFDNVLCMAIYGAFFILYAGLHYKEFKTVISKVRA
ncbi:lipopolysaccharide biosynthesis protein [Acidaminococcus timonensis]|uniref:lipopolysaccharide biosynthesis protein n=1 Tax=Acidaminococcus timonensis TaxID=1871002 RepID=UPI0026EA004A|nr:sugar transporter [Acidaminococcus timonensis]